MPRTALGVSGPGLQMTSKLFQYIWRNQYQSPALYIYRKTGVYMRIPIFSYFCSIYKMLHKFVKKHTLNLIGKQNILEPQNNYQVGKVSKKIY